VLPSELQQGMKCDAHEKLIRKNGKNKKKHTKKKFISKKNDQV
jgi:hypothetical protein